MIGLLSWPTPASLQADAATDPKPEEPEGDRLARFFFGERHDPSLRPNSYFEADHRWWVELMVAVHLPEGRGRLAKGECYDWHVSPRPGYVVIEPFRQCDYRQPIADCVTFLERDRELELPVSSVGFFTVEVDPRTRMPAFRVWRSGHREPIK